MNRLQKLSPLAIFTQLLPLLGVGILFQACGSKESMEPTMENMQGSMVDAIKIISTNTVTEMTKLADKGAVIETPGSLEKVKSALSVAGKSDLVSGYTSSLNETAAGALSGYKGTLNKTIESMPLPNVDEIAKGGDDSLTRHFEKNAKDKIKESLLPYVKGAVKNSAAGDWVEKIKGAIPEQTGGILGKIQSATGIEMPTNLDPENYVTDQLSGKFFDIMAKQEKLFRQDPKGKSAELFKKAMEVAK